MWALLLTQVFTLGLSHRTVLPSTTDSTIATCSSWDECPDRGHEVYRYTGIAQDHWWIAPKLLVILKAHCSEAAPNCPNVYPMDYSGIVDVAVQQSYRAVIILDWPNLNSVGHACQSSGPSCAGNMRDEIAFGTASSNKSTMSTHPQDAIVPRLRSLLAYLKATYPSEGWDKWMPATTINWADVTLAGHSGYAAYIATKKDVSRVAMFAEPADDNASWITAFPGSSATDVSKFVGLVHDPDDITPNLSQRVQANWATMLVPSGQRIVSTAPCGTGCLPHRKIVEDSAEYADEWATMLGWGD